MNNQPRRNLELCSLSINASAAPQHLTKRRKQSPPLLAPVAGEGETWNPIPDGCGKVFLKDLLDLRNFLAFEDIGRSEIHRVHYVQSAYGSRYGSGGDPYFDS